MPPYSVDARYWYPPLIGNIQLPVRSNSADPQVYPQTTPMVSFEMNGDVPSDVMRIEHSGGAYAHSLDVNNPNYYASTHPHTSTSVATDDPRMLLQHPRHPHSQAQQHRGVPVNNAYGVWSGAPTGLG
jgi:hypothetical protein